jgi:phage-related protein
LPGVSLTIGRVKYIGEIDDSKMPAEARRVGRKIGKEMGSSGGDQFDKSWDEHSQSFWKRLSANTRQWTLIISTIAAGASDIAGLASAAGAGLIVLGAGLTSTLIGAGALIAVFKGLTGDLADLPAEVRPAAKAFQSLGDTMKELQKAIQVAALRNAADSFDSLRETALALKPALEVVGQAIGDIIGDLAKNLKPGTQGFDTLNRLVVKAGGNIRKIASVAGKFLLGLGISFDKSQPYLDQFLDGMGKLADSFIKLTSSSDFDRWIQRSSITLGKLGSLIGAATKAITDLVTPEAQDRLDTFIDNLTEFMPNLSNLLDNLGKLDVFGLIAQALNDVGKALEPLTKPLGDLFDALNRIVGIAIDQWASDLGELTAVVGPLTQALADFLGQVDPQAIRNIADALAVVAAVALVKKIASLSTALGSLGKKSVGIAGLAIAVDGLNKTLETFGKTDAASSFDRLLGTLQFGGGVAAFLATAATGITVGLGALFVAIGALVAGFISTLIDTITGESWLEKLFKDFDNGVLIPFYNYMGTALANGWTQITNFFNTVAGGFVTFVVNLGLAVVNGWNQITTFFSNAWTVITTSIQAWWNGIVAGWNGFWGDTWTAVTNGWNQIVTAFNTFFANLKTGWDNFWNGFGGIVSDIWTNIENTVNDSVNNVIDFINDMIRGINRGLDAIKDITGGLVNLKIPTIPKTASGGVFYGAQARIIGEAGPEAVVPLSRPLSQVSPAVRALSAFAQGAGGGSGSTGPAKIVNVDSGAIVVAGVRNPYLAANAVLDNLVTKL